jgi:hypothetical protein
MEASEVAAASLKTPPPGITVTIHLDNNPKMILKIEHHQQLGDSFDYSKSDLHNVINIGRNMKTVIINNGEDHEEVEAYSPTSNFKLPNNYGYNSRKRRSNKTVPPPQLTKQSKIDSTHQKLHSRCFLHPKGKHSNFQCINLRKALGAPPPSADKDKKNQDEQNLF